MKFGKIYACSKRKTAFAMQNFSKFGGGLGGGVPIFGQDPQKALPCPETCVYAFSYVDRRDLSRNVNRRRDGESKQRNPKM